MSKSYSSNKDQAANAVPVFILQNNNLALAYHYSLYYAGYVFELQRNNKNETWLNIQYPVDFASSSYTIFRVGELVDVCLENFRSACDIFITHNPNFTALQTDRNCFCGEIYLYLAGELEYEKPVELRSEAVSSFEKLKKEALANQCLQAVEKYKQLFGDEDYDDFYTNSYCTWKAEMEAQKKLKGTSSG